MFDIAFLRFFCRQSPEVYAEFASDRPRAVLTVFAITAGVGERNPPVDHGRLVFLHSLSRRTCGAAGFS